MTKSELFRKAHALAKSTIQVGDNYRVTFAAALRIVKNSKESAVMEGSEKQVAWAKDIKANLMAGRHRDIARIEAMVADLKSAGEEIPEHVYAGLTKIREELEMADRITSAKWWIDNRFGITRRHLLRAI